MYDKGRDKFAGGDIDWTNDTIKAVLVDANDYTKDLVNHEFLTDIPSAARVASATLANKSRPNSDGACDADDVVFSSVTGDESEQIIIYKDTGDENTSPLICNFDTATGLPVTPNGGDITVSWQDTSPYIFKL